MISQLVVTPDGNRRDLVGDVQAAWNAFATAIPNHPLANIPAQFDCQWPETFESVAIAVPEFAADPANDTGKIVLGRRFLDAGYSEDRRNLTLLHESIHLLDQTSTHRDRTRQLEQARTALFRNHNRAYPLGHQQPDREMHAYHRMIFGFEFLKMPDEVWAELFLRDHYPGLFDARMASYLQLRDDASRRANHTALQSCIRKFYLAYEWFTLELARKIDQDATRLGRLIDLQADWRADLVAMVGEDDARCLLERAAGLLPADVAGIVPADFDQFFNDIMATPLPN